MDTTGAGDGFLGGFLHYLVKAGDMLLRRADTHLIKTSPVHAPLLKITP